MVVLKKERFSWRKNYILRKLQNKQTKIMTLRESVNTESKIRAHPLSGNTFLFDTLN